MCTKAKKEAEAKAKKEAEAKAKKEAEAKAKAKAEAKKTTDETQAMLNKFESAFKDCINNMGYTVTTKGKTSQSSYGVSQATYSILNEYTIAVAVKEGVIYRVDFSFDAEILADEELHNHALEIVQILYHLTGLDFNQSVSGRYVHVIYQ